MVSKLVVPVIDVHNDNFKELWPALVLAIKTSSFVALDTELSGLGNRKSLLAESIEDRYRAICQAARSRSILSLGIACFKRLDDKAAETYLIQVYNLTLLCSEEYVIEPQSVQFLVQHGFDFNKQYASGIPYLKGNGTGASDNQGVHIRALFTELLRARKPVVFHNGLIDIAFLYQSFYSHLPERLDTFTANLSEMFPAGIYDTKYVTEFELRLTASYLEYAYKKCKLDNSRHVASGGTGPHVHTEFCQYAGAMSSYVDYRVCPAVASAEGPTNVCQRFSAFGWCPNGAQCLLSHDTDLIIFQDEKGVGDKRKRRKRNRNKKRGRGEVEDDPSIFGGAPEKKILHMEADPGETPTDPRPEGGLLADVDGNPPQSESADMEADGERNGDDPNCRNPVMVAPVAEDDTNVKNNTNESREEDGDGGGGGGPLSGDPSKAEAPKTKADPGTHRAGFDAFMTAYIFAHSCSLIKKEGVRAVEKKEKKEEKEEKKEETEKKEEKEEEKKEKKEETEKKEEEKGEPSWLPSCLNKVYLSGKATPLNVVKSTFARSSKAHIQKMKMVWGGSV
ncbi:target of EGR1 protein 1 [Pseudoliparis swirei]|uniref:target of EGR1 protein 1 n=1 Tax=Pseudoliparis swirei TaxID=2059687 RepID=UPI0024BE0BB4|nr:target of EGR1 protein 1 [Pseudoliparis swirei]